MRDGALGFERPPGGGGVAGPSRWIQVDEADGGEGTTARLGAKGVRGKLSQVAEGSGRHPGDFGAASSGWADAWNEELGGPSRGDGAGNASKLRAACAAAGEAVASGTVAGSTTAAASDGIDPQYGGAGARLSAPGA